jgi:hypothetical protein
LHNGYAKARLARHDSERRRILATQQAKTGASLCEIFAADNQEIRAATSPANFLNQVIEC